MAELLIKAIDAVHKDPVKDQCGCYKRGDVVAVREDGFEWGRLESLPPEKGGKFTIVRLPGVSLKELPDLMAPHTDAKQQITGRRAIKIDLDALPKDAIEAAHKDGLIELKKESLETIAVDKSTGKRPDLKPIEKEVDDATAIVDR